MKKPLILGLGLFYLITNLSFAEDKTDILFKEAFKEGFKIGKEYGEQEILSYIRDLKWVLKVEREIFQGKLPACYIDKFGRVKLLTPLNLEEKVKASSLLKPGYYVVFDLEGYPDWFKGYVFYILRKHNYNPKFAGKIIVVYQTSLGDAEELLKFAKNKLKIEGVIFTKE